MRVYLCIYHPLHTQVYVIGADVFLLWHVYLSRICCVCCAGHCLISGHRRSISDHVSAGNTKHSRAELFSLVLLVPLWHLHTELTSAWVHICSGARIAVLEHQWTQFWGLKNNLSIPSVWARVNRAARGEQRPVFCSHRATIDRRCSQTQRLVVCSCWPAPGGSPYLDQGDPHLLHSLLVAQPHAHSAQVSLVPRQVDRVWMDRKLLDIIGCHVLINVNV